MNNAAEARLDTEGTLHHVIIREIERDPFLPMTWIGTMIL